MLIPQGAIQQGWCGLYVKENPPHNIPLRNDQVKVGVEEVRDEDASIPVPIQEVQLVVQTLNTFVAWLTHLVKRLSEQVFHCH